MKVATSIAIGKQADSALASQAALQAMHKAGITIANSVLLLLSSEFASDPQPAILAAAKAANCTQVFGCSASGIFTEDDWVLDSPAAAVMVFGGEVSIQQADLNHASQPLLTLTAPNALNNDWLQDGQVRYGGVSGDAVGHGPFSVWKNAKGESTGHIEAFIKGTKLVSKASHGLKFLTKPKKIQQANGYDVELVGNQAAYLALKKAWNTHGKASASSKGNRSGKNEVPLPSHLVMATYADSAEAILNGEFEQTSVISFNEENDSITLAQALKANQYLCWGVRDKTAAESDLLLTSIQLTEQLKALPDFGLLFSCLGRGPFYDGIDHDLNVITKQFPEMPLLGFYGNGEIASVAGKNQLLSYSAVLSLFSKLS